MCTRSRVFVAVPHAIRVRGGDAVGDDVRRLRVQPGRLVRHPLLQVVGEQLV